MTTATDRPYFDEVREVVAEVLEIEPEELTETSHFIEDHEVDSLRGIEILARLEKKYKLDIPQSELARMVTLESVYGVVAERAGWSG